VWSDPCYPGTIADSPRKSWEIALSWVLVWFDSGRRVDVGTGEEDLEEGDPEIAVEGAGRASRSQGEEVIVVLENPLVERKEDGNEKAAVEQVGEKRTPRVGDVGWEMGQTTVESSWSTNEACSTVLVGEEAMELVRHGCHGGE